MNIEDLERRVSQLEQALKETGRYLCTEEESGAVRLT